MQCFDQRLLSEGAAESEPGETARFGKGLNDQQIGEFGDQLARGFRAIVDICFVDNDHRFGIVRE